MIGYREVGQYKRNHGGYLDASREQEVLRRVKGYLKDKDLEEDLCSSSKLMEISRECRRGKYRITSI